MHPGRVILEGDRSEASRPCGGDADTDRIAEIGE
jgi:hypothetical protein